MECPQLLDAVLFIFAFLVLVFETRGAPLRFKNSLNFSKRQLVPLAQFTEKSANRPVHDAAKAQYRLRPFLQGPQPPEQKLLRAFSIVVHRRRTQSQRLRTGWMKSLSPTRNPGENSGLALADREEQCACRSGM